MISTPFRHRSSDKVSLCSRKRAAASLKQRADFWISPRSHNVIPRFIRHEACSRDLLNPLDNPWASLSNARARSKSPATLALVACLTRREQVGPLESASAPDPGVEKHSAKRVRAEATIGSVFPILMVPTKCRKLYFRAKSNVKVPRSHSPLSLSKRLARRCLVDISLTAPILRAFRNPR